MDYHNHHRIGPSIPVPHFYDLSQSSTYQTSRLPPVTEAPRLPPPIDAYKSNTVNVGFAIHKLELKAYAAVLKAFKIQSDLLSWGKEGLITELRKELNVTDQEHRTFLTLVNSDESIKMIRELQQGVIHTRELPSKQTYAPVSGQYADISTPQNNVKLSGADVSTMQRYVAHNQPIPAPVPTQPLQKWDDFKNGQLSTYHTRNTEKPMRIVFPGVTNHSKSNYKGPVQPHPKNLIHVAEAHNYKKKSGIIKICATETVLSKVREDNLFC